MMRVPTGRCLSYDTCPKMSSTRGYLVIFIESDLHQGRRIWVSSRT